MPKKSAPVNETPEQKFIRLANGRSDAAMLAIENLGKLVGPQYKSTPEQHARLYEGIRHKLDRAFNALKENRPATRIKEGLLK